MRQFCRAKKSPAFFRDKGDQIMEKLLFTSESVTEGHPDKVADQISDAILDQFLAYDEGARCAIESFVTTGQVVIMGEVSSEVYIDLQTIARNTIKRIGYTKAEYKFDADSCGIFSALHEQSADINRGVEREEEAVAGRRVVRARRR
jgi:S-adenosylmethionine synthetase